LIGIGGSATNDGGAGMAETLGVRFWMPADGRCLPGAPHCRTLTPIDLRGLDQRIRGVRGGGRLRCAQSPDRSGRASAVFGPQKGASSSDIALLDAALMRYRDVIRKELGTDVQLFPGSGAAGGLGAGLLAFCRRNCFRGSIWFLSTPDSMQRSAVPRPVITARDASTGKHDSAKSWPEFLRAPAAPASPPPPMVATSRARGKNSLAADGFADLETLVNAETALEEAITHAHHSCGTGPAGLIRATPVPASQSGKYLI